MSSVTRYEVNGKITRNRLVSLYRSTWMKPDVRLLMLLINSCNFEYIWFSKYTLAEMLDVTPQVAARARKKLVERGELLYLGRVKLPNSNRVDDCWQLAPPIVEEDLILNDNIYIVE